MKGEFTPGPWHEEPLQATQGADIAIVADGGIIVAVVQHDPELQEDPDNVDGDNVVWHPDQKPTARLIAAAPELLAALVALVEAPDDNSRYNAALDAHAAIAKATGKPE